MLIKLLCNVVWQLEMTPRELIGSNSFPPKCQL